MIVWARYAFNVEIRKQMIDFWIRGYTFQQIADGSQVDPKVVEAVITNFLRRKRL